MEGLSRRIEPVLLCQLIVTPAVKYLVPLPVIHMPHRLEAILARAMMIHHG